MLASAQRVLECLPDGVAPASGTGPCGAPSGRRWITARDVVVHNLPLRMPGAPGGAPRPAYEGRAVGATAPDAPAHLRAYQLEAVRAVCGDGDGDGDGDGAPVRPRSGIVEMGCGLGKTFVGGEVLRRARAPAVVVTLSSVAVEQWTAHLRERVGLADVREARDPWRSADGLPDAVVVTYHLLARVAEAMLQHAAALAGEATAVGTQDEGDVTDLLWMLHVVPFGVLLLDEVHMAVAEHFQIVCALRASSVVGLSGSLVREDDRLQRLDDHVGPRLYRHVATRPNEYEVVRVALGLGPKAAMASAGHRSALGQAIEACHPVKVRALRRILAREADGRCLVFCDSLVGCRALHAALPGALLLVGSTAIEERRRVLDEFGRRGGVVLATRVCDASIDFPPDTVVVCVHSSSGSRQQEVQRCGRGSRGATTGARVVHVVNRDTPEERFVERRVRYVCDAMATTVTRVDDPDESPVDVDGPLGAPYRSVLRTLSARRNVRARGSRSGRALASASRASAT